MSSNIVSGSAYADGKKDVVYFYVNQRPVSIPKSLTILFNQNYRQYNPGAKYTAILNVIISPSNENV